MVPLSALEHWSYCRRQCGLIHLENLWGESCRTAEGRVFHERADLPGLEKRPGLRTERALELRSSQHQMAGRADVVVFLDDPTYPVTGRPFPVEYKRGARNAFLHAELQLCGQAICLEEMLRVPVPSGAIFHGASHRRREVAFSEELRARTLQAAGGILEMIRSQRLPPSEVGAKCEECSLRELCLPDLPGTPRVRKYLEGLS